MQTIGQNINCSSCKISSVCFKKLLTSQLDFININKTQIVYRKGENIIKQGAFASYVPYIADGLALNYLEGNGYKDVNIGISTTSEFLGLSALFGENKYNYSARAIKDSTICLIEKSSFSKLLHENGNFASEVIKGFCQKEKKLFNKINSLGHKQMNGRLADVILYLCDSELAEYEVSGLLSRKDIADFACISTESIVRIMTELKSEKIIDMDKRKITILDKEKLLTISAKG